MELGLDRQRAIDVLEFWHKIEFFVPYDLGRILKGRNEHYWLNQDAAGESLTQYLFWLNPHSRVDEVGYNLYLGILEVADIRKACRAAGLFEADEYRRLENIQRGIEQTCFAKLAIDKDGRADISKFSVSTLPWALGRLQSGRLNELTSAAFVRARRELYFELQNFEAGLRRSQRERAPEGSNLNGLPSPLYGEDIVKLVELLFSWADFRPNQQRMGLLEVYPLKHRRSATMPLPTRPDQNEDQEEDDETDTAKSIDILNSFYLEDLEEAIRSIRSGDRHVPLDHYLQDSTEDRLDVYTDSGRAEILRRLQPKFISSARWLDGHSHRMSLMQQFAINSYLEDCRSTGLFSVNGPPGTGKTTLLKEIIAHNVVQRANVLSTMRSPEDACVRKESISFIGDGKSYSIGILDERLTGFEMVVTSSNNAAVENVSKDLPLDKSRDAEWNEVSYLLPVAKMVCADVRDGHIVPLKDDERPWGLIAGVLGNKTNCREFAQKLVYDPRDEEEVEERKQRGEYLNIRDWADRQAGTSFAEASRLFRQCKAKVEHRVTELQDYSLLHGKFSGLSEDFYCEEAFQQQSQALERLACAKSKNLDTETRRVSLIELQNRLEREEQLLQSLKSAWYQPLFLWSRENKAHKTALRNNRQEQIDSSRAIREMEETLSRNGEDLESAACALTEAQNKLDEKKVEFNSAKSRLASYADKFPVLGTPRSPEELEEREYQISAPWQDTELNELRSQLFAAALKLHESWLAAVLKRRQGFRPNTIAIAKLLEGKMPSNPEHALPIWQSLFMIVPVISTTFASFHRLFQNLPAKSIGSVFMDEAGQAVPQAAIGALRKCKRAIVIGDPMQIEPIFAVDIKLIELLGNRDSDLISGYGPHLVSVQARADSSNRFGTTLESDAKSAWIGSPLRVHRRCSNPMFDVANRIAYNEKMIQAKVEVAYPGRAGDSCWFHLPGICSDEQYVAEQGEFMFEQVRLAYVRDGNVLPSIYIISPFRKVAERLRQLLGSQLEWKKRLALGAKLPARRPLRSWTSKRIGTVHTFQGKEEQDVYFVLGADSNSSGSARWAAGKPNLLNVALTRAKSHIYVVGDLELWGKQRYFEQIAGAVETVDLTKRSSAFAN